MVDFLTNIKTIAEPEPILHDDEINLILHTFHAIAWEQNRPMMSGTIVIRGNRYKDLSQHIVSANLLNGPYVDGEFNSDEVAERSINELCKDRFSSAYQDLPADLRYREGIFEEGSLLALALSATYGQLQISVRTQPSEYQANCDRLILWHLAGAIAQMYPRELSLQHSCLTTYAKEWQRQEAIDKTGSLVTMTIVKAQQYMYDSGDKEVVKWRQTAHGSCFFERAVCSD